MRLRRLGSAGLLLAVLGWNCPVLAQPSEVAPAPILPEKSAGRVLIVGNSYVRRSKDGRSLADLLNKLAASAQPPATLKAEVCSTPNMTLEGHLAKDRKQIGNGNWDLVILQEFSTRPLTDPSKMLDAARSLDALIRNHGGRTALLVTWARKNRPQNFEKIAKTYRQVGSQLQAPAIPAGAAWELVLKERPELPLYEKDGSHPLDSGFYLNACVLFAALTGRCPQGLSGCDLKGLEPPTRDYLQEVAWRACRPPPPTPAPDTVPQGQATAPSTVPQRQAPVPGTKTDTDTPE